MWREKRSGGYWRCLLPWLLLIDFNYEIKLVSNGKKSLLQVREISATHRPPKIVSSVKELENEIADRLKKDLLAISRINQTMPDSWLDPEVRASLIRLLAGARGLIHIGVFSPCLQHFVNILRHLLYKQYDKSLQTYMDSEKEDRTRRRARREFKAQFDPSKSCIDPVAFLFLPGELHTFCLKQPKEETKKNGWFAMRWHEDTFLAAAGYRKENLIHAEHPYFVLNSNTFWMRTVDAMQWCNKESWIVGAITLNSVFQANPNRQPRMTTPHIETEAHSLEMLYMAAERVLKVKIGVLWSQSEGVIPAIILKGPLDFLDQIASWIPGITILGNGFQAPPALANRKERLYFSRGKFAARVWNQDQLRQILSRRKEALQAELGGERPRGSGEERNTSNYLPHSIADAVILYLHLKFNLPVQTVDGAAWPLVLQSASNGLSIPQHIMLPKTLAVFVADDCTLEVAVDSENKFVLKNCHIVAKNYELNELTEYRLYSSSGTSFERITTGTLADCAFFKLDQRVLIGPAE